MTSSGSTQRTRRGPKTRVNAKYKVITRRERIQIIYLNTVHRVPPHQIERELEIQYNSIRNILNIFHRTGLTEKRPFKCKEFLDEANPKAFAKQEASLPSYVTQLTEESWLFAPQKMQSLLSTVDQADPTMPRNSNSQQEPLNNIQPQEPWLEAKDAIEQSSLDQESSLRSIIVLEAEEDKKNKINLRSNNKREPQASSRKIDESKALLKLSLQQETGEEHQCSQIQKDSLKLNGGGPNECSLPYWRLSPSELVQFKHCSAYTKPFSGGFGYLNNYTDLDKRKKLLGYFDKSQRRRAARNLKTLPTFSFGSES